MDKNKNKKYKNIESCVACFCVIRYGIPHLKLAGYEGVCKIKKRSGETKQLLQDYFSNMLFHLLICLVDLEI